MRVILKGNRYSKVRGMLEELDWMNVEESMRMNLMIFVYKLDCGLLPSYFDKCRVRGMNVYSCNTRYMKNLMIGKKRERCAAQRCLII
jgi:hypothetical protein